MSLEDKTVSFDASKALQLQELQSQLASKFTISNVENIFSGSGEASDLKKLYPLFLIFIYIIAAAIFINYKDFKIEHFMLDFMGLFYIVFSFFKFLDYKGFPVSFKMYDPLAKVFPAYGWVYPFLETVLGIMFLARIEINLALIVTIVVLGITTFGVTKSLFSKQKIKCACLGTALNLPMTKATFIENSIMIAMAVFMLIKTYI